MRSKLVLFLANLLAQTVAVDHVNIGVIFPIATLDYQPRREGAIVIDVIQMAIDEINDKSDGQSDDLLPGVELRVVARTAPGTFYGGSGAAIALTKANNGEGVVSSIGPFTYEAIKGCYARKCLIFFSSL
jgi:hypothetical protein